MSYIDKLDICHIGKRATCVINETEIKSSRIQFEKGRYYICQNLMPGMHPKDKLGYKAAWCVEDGGPRALSRNAVTCLSVQDEDWDFEENV